MTPQQMAIAAELGTATEDDAVRTVAENTQTGLDRSTPSRRASSAGSFAPTQGPRPHTLVLTGELDRASAHALEAEIDRLCEEGVTSITLDLRELTYIDAIGVAVIAFRCGLCERRGCDVTLIPGSLLIQNAFERAGIVGMLPFKKGDVSARRLRACPPTALEPLSSGDW